MNSAFALADLLAGTTLDAERPFSAPWEARAFAIAVRMREMGLCTWDDFRRHLIAEIGKADKAQAHGWIEPGDGYYTHFLGALENLLREKGIIDASALAAKMRALGDPD
jgi:nitrile hydratase accessory protein